jgi:hypothetical protein
MNKKPLQIAQTSNCGVLRMLQPRTPASQEKSEQTARQTATAATGEDERGDLLIRGFWARGTDCMWDVVRVTDTKPNPTANGILPKC